MGAMCRRVPERGLDRHRLALLPQFANGGLDLSALGRSAT
jgi:hypothetical protein